MFNFPTSCHRYCAPYSTITSSTSSRTTFMLVPTISSTQCWHLVPDSPRSVMIPSSGTYFHGRRNFPLQLMLLWRHWYVPTNHSPHSSKPRLHRSDIESVAGEKVTITSTAGALGTISSLGCCLTSSPVTCMRSVSLSC